MRLEKKNSSQQSAITKEAQIFRLSLSLSPFTCRLSLCVQCVQ